MKYIHSIHILIFLFLLPVVQAGKGSNFGASFGGGLLGGMMGNALTQPRTSRTEIVQVAAPAPQQQPSQDDSDYNDMATVRKLRKENRFLKQEIKDLTEEIEELNEKIKTISKEHERLKKEKK